MEGCKHGSPTIATDNWRLWCIKPCCYKAPSSQHIADWASVVEATALQFRLNNPASEQIHPMQGRVVPAYNRRCLLARIHGHTNSIVRRDNSDVGQASTPDIPEVDGAAASNHQRHA